LRCESENAEYSKKNDKWLCYLFAVGCRLGGCGAVRRRAVRDDTDETMGNVCFELYYTNVPRTVANFVSLAEGSRPWLDPRKGFVSTKPYYNGTIFHRVITNFMIQCGLPKGDGADGPGYTIEDEFDPALRHDRPGIVSMANSGPDSNGGQFFITVAPTEWLDNKHSVFGFVVEGMNIVSNIAIVATDSGDRPLVDIAITNVFITRNGTNAQNFAVTNQLLPEVASLPIEITDEKVVKISTGTATSSYQYVYSSTNLIGWTEYTNAYRVLPDGAMDMSPATEARGFFRATRVVYPADKNRTASPIRHRLVMTMGANIVNIAPETFNSGIVSINEDPDHNVTDWIWDAEPHLVWFAMASDYYYPLGFELHYSTSTNGVVVVYQYLDYNWKFVGEGTFTDQDLN
jgi:peptidyl-prolyl cis-trans isomerase A (cyclophilin A)